MMGTSLRQRLHFYRGEPSPVRAARGDLRRLRMAWTVIWFGWLAELAAKLECRSHDRWVLAGRHRDAHLGMPPGHPDAEFWGPDAPILSGELCRRPDPLD